MDMVISVVLVVLVVAAIWLVVELALTVRRTRPAIEEATQVIGKAKVVVDDLSQQVGPLVAHLDEAVASVRPVIDDAAPVLEKTSQAVDSLNADLIRVEAILADASSITGAASNVTVSASAAAGAIVGKVRDRLTPSRTAPGIPSVSVDDSATVETGAERVLPDESDADPTPAPAAGPADAEPAPGREPKAGNGYFTYPPQ